MHSNKNFAAALAQRQLPIRVIYLASYPPRKCGIATFTKDLTSAINDVNPDALAEIIALNDSKQEYDYPWEVKLRIGQHQKSDYMMAARYINQSSADVVCLQHEFGLFGGPEGNNSACLSAGTTSANALKKDVKSRYYLADMLEQIEKPIVTTLHTILPNPDANYLYMMCRVIDLSKAVVAMTEDARKVLIDVYGCPPEKAIVIYHGVPDFSFNEIAKHKRKLHIQAEPMLLSAGLLGPGKGTESIIEAMPAIRRVFKKAKLYVVGQTHPVILRTEGEKYRDSLAQLIKKLRLSHSVRLINSYMSTEELRQYYQAADFFITAHKNLEQSGSGTLAWGLGAGKVCISTPYNYAKEVLDKGAGVLVKPGSSTAIADSVLDIYSDQKHMHQIRERAYDKGRKFTWPNVGLNYLNLFKLVVQQATNKEDSGTNI
ncbi:MAG TPA: glycosyltransferase [Patescibacteria group bacterium]|jgi:glycosyltransferase involved in cell wall biosynthesis|nr:glycosyltransferase [Patescibacteria group bacterium]